MSDSAPETPAPASENPKKVKPGFFSIENLRSLGTLIIIIFSLRWSIASPYHVPTASMEPTIKVGDRLLANKLAYNLRVPFTDIVVAEWGKPQRGDIVVFKAPPNPDLDYVKRVVAIEGDEVKLVDDILYVNGKPYERKDHNEDRRVLDDIVDPKEQKLLFQETINDKKHWTIQNIPSLRAFQQRNLILGADRFVVPKNSVFCMGDNRDNSHDGRIWGELPLEFVRGKAMFVLWSAYKPNDQLWPIIRWNRFGHWLDSL